MAEQDLNSVVEKAVREALEDRHIEDGTVGAFEDVVNEIVKKVTAIPGLAIAKEDHG
jgi:hypothetical protein